ncbi:unnamed protein product [Anisakis simplex]|uniref:Uncharacterized protein n=1 Tax=Anisakis simplex TaxID=6269 RepID=A0A0M3JX58_ANISI|nr:unnamed protein product [Anisakis simplex]
MNLGLVDEQMSRSDRIENDRINQQLTDDEWFLIAYLMVLAVGSNKRKMSCGNNSSSSWECLDEIVEAI